VTLLAPEDGRLLLRVARSAIAEALRAAPPDGALEAALACEPLRRPGAAFVSLHLDRELRGCVGTLEPSRALADTVAEHALAAALEDPRFPPLPAAELPAVRLSVSVLGRLTPVLSPEAIVLGRHGVRLSKGRFHAVFLPQVAGEQGWGLEELLDNLARKAGLRRQGDWLDASLAVFEAQVFEEGPSAILPAFVGRSPG
jgi:AmmeMemoRadiSam system protein A